jgi:hypothetical protein
MKSSTVEKTFGTGQKRLRLKNQRRKSLRRGKRSPKYF